MIKRLFPRSLIGQISLIMVLGLLFELLVSVQIYTHERRQTLTHVSSYTTLARVGALINVLNRAPTEIHEEIIAASQGPGFTLSLGPNALIEKDERPDLTALLKQKLTLPQPQKIRLQSILGESEGTVDSMMSRMDPAQTQEMMNHMETIMSPQQMQHMMRNMRQSIQVSGAIELSAGHWLNFSSALNENASRWSQKALLSLVLVALITLGAMVWVVRRALRPVKHLGQAAQMAGQQRDFSPLKVTGPSEIESTVRAFNKMQSRLAHFIEDRTRMLAAISHDLRTPITSLRLRLEFIEPGEDTQQMLATLEQMEAMIQATLNFARDDAKKEQSQAIELVSLLQSICDDYQDLGHSVTLDAPEKVIYHLWPLAFRRVMENLLNNSLRYGLKNPISDKDSAHSDMDNPHSDMDNPHSDIKNPSSDVGSSVQPSHEPQVSIFCYQEEKYIVIQVQDPGPGIDDAKLEEVFKPFVRLDKARDLTHSSVGLGLSISRTIIQAHGGSLHLHNRPEGGLCAEIRLPVHNPKNLS